MTFISYAQNLEDLVLFRALKEVSDGFYIDVGANEPETDSVTKAFYEMGWSGINIEPERRAFEKLSRERKRDVNLNIGAGAKKGRSSFCTTSIRGHSHFVKGQEMEQGGEIIDIFPLKEIIAQHAPEKSEIHFLKIDVEGFERQVLEGMDFSLYRPWIVVVEAMVPQMQIEAHEEWEDILLSNGYHFTYADGLNRFYIDNAQSKLLDSFNYPPNVFDDYIRYDLLRKEEIIQDLNKKTKIVSDKAQNSLIQANEKLVRALDIETERKELVVQLDEANKKLLKTSNLLEKQKHDSKELVSLREKIKKLEEEKSWALAQNHTNYMAAQEADAKISKIMEEKSWALAQNHTNYMAAHEADAKISKIMEEKSWALMQNHTHYTELQESREKIRILEIEKSDALTQNHLNHMAVQNMLNSYSWKATAPFRASSRALKTPLQSIKHTAKASLIGAGFYFKDKPTARRLILKGLGYSPRLKNYFISLITIEIQNQNALLANHSGVEISPYHLTPMGKEYLKLISPKLKRWN